MKILYCYIGDKVLKFDVVDDLKGIVVLEHKLTNNINIKIQAIWKDFHYVYDTWNNIYSKKYDRYFRDAEFFDNIKDCKENMYRKNIQIFTNHINSLNKTKKELKGKIIKLEEKKFLLGGDDCDCGYCLLQGEIHAAKITGKIIFKNNKIGYLTEDNYVELDCDCNEIGGDRIIFVADDNNRIKIEYSNIFVYKDRESVLTEIKEKKNERINEAINTNNREISKYKNKIRDIENLL